MTGKLKGTVKSGLSLLTTLGNNWRVAFLGYFIAHCLPESNFKYYTGGDDFIGRIARSFLPALRYLL